MTNRRFSAVVDFDLPVNAVFEYLGDPRNRPEWQSSLMSVTLKERTEPYVGMRWTETTMVGVRPRMEITEIDPPTTWSEHGRWRGVSADLTLRFAEIPRGCQVTAEGLVVASGVYSLAAIAAGRLASSAIRSDLRRAARILAGRGS